MEPTEKRTHVTTGAINQYDGIFKFVHGDKAQQHFARARRLLAQNGWDDAMEAFQEAKACAVNSGYDSDAVVVEGILQEMAAHRDRQMAEGQAATPVDWSAVGQRSLRRLQEPHDRLPQGLFFLTLGDAAARRRLVGRKTLSDKWLENRIPELYCSLIRPDMLLGELLDLRLTDHSVVLFYFPFENGEKLRIFEDIYRTDGVGSELVFPFPLLKTATRKEFTSPSEGWQVDNAYDDMLSNGEEHVRSYTAQFLSSLALTKPRLYDPACSTGIFLSSLKASVPDAYTIGQDLSLQMTNISRERLDEAHHGNALVPKIQLFSADAVFIRFLNSEVVTSTEAEMLLPPLLTTVAVGGVCVVLGHTPVLLSAANFRSLPDFRLERCVAVDVEKKGIFQYYILKRMQC